VYYESFGEGRPIVFLPGWGGDNGEGRDIHEPVFEGRTGWRRIADLEFLNRIHADVRTYALSDDPATRFEGPTLIVTGRQDTMTGYADAWSILDDYPRATYAVLDQEGHGLPVGRTALYRALVADWLDRIEHPDA
jgi:pimeloyl-ACP methyl ester carboxylesterase